MYKTQDMVSLTNINSLNIDMMKIKRYLMSAFCLCMFTACDSDDNNLLCYGTHTDIEGDVTAFGAVVHCLPLWSWQQSTMWKCPLCRR